MYLKKLLTYWAPGNEQHFSTEAEESKVKVELSGSGQLKN